MSAERRPDLLSQRLVSAAIGWVWLAFAWHAVSSSVVIAGERYFILSDDALISMRYADNLARGLGLVWNPGERVEGYSNLLWTLWMAVLHLLPIPKSKIPLLVGASACTLITLTVLRLRDTTGRVLAWEDRTPGAAVPWVQVAPSVLLVTSMSFLSWAFGGLEVAVLVFLAALVLDQFVQWCLASAAGARRRIEWRVGVTLGVGLLVRDDFITVGAAAFVALAAVTWHRRGHWRQYAGLMLVMLLPLVVKLGHVAFRYAYYDSLVPNTYVVKVMGWPWPQRFHAGVAYVMEAGARLAIFLPPLALGLWKRRGTFETAGAVCAYAGITVGVLSAYVTFVGGDAFKGDRLFLTAYPALLCGAVLGAYVASRRSRRPGPLLLAMLAVLLLLSGDHARIWSSGVRVHDQVNAAWNIVVARYLASTHPAARVGVFWAGGVPYYSGLESVDLLGLNDRTIASGPYRGRNPAPGHGKHNYEYVFAKRTPDVIVGPFERYAEVADYEERPDEVVARMSARAERSDYPFAPALFASREFLSCYYPNQARIPFAFFPSGQDVYRPPVYLRCSQTVVGGSPCKC